MTELFDDVAVRAKLKRAVAEAGGVLSFCSKHKLRPRDVDQVIGGMFAVIPYRVLASVGFELHVRYRKIGD